MENKIHKKQANKQNNQTQTQHTLIDNCDVEVCCSRKELSVWDRELRFHPLFPNALQFQIQPEMKRILNVDGKYIFEGEKKLCMDSKVICTKTNLSFNFIFPWTF